MGSLTFFVKSIDMGYSESERELRESGGDGGPWMVSKWKPGGGDGVPVEEDPVELLEDISWCE